MTKTEIAREFIARFPELENRTLARVMHKEKPKVFTSLENARQMIRHVRGAKGKESKQGIADKSMFKPIGWQQNVMPKTLSRSRKPIVLEGALKVLILSDIHIPYHDEAAVAAVSMNIGIGQYGLRVNSLFHLFCCKVCYAIVALDTTQSNLMLRSVAIERIDHAYR